MGEAKRKLETHKEMLLSCAGVQTMAGKVQVRWETASAATPMGQLACFKLRSSCPTHPSGIVSVITSSASSLASRGHQRIGCWGIMRMASADCGF